MTLTHSELEEAAGLLYTAQAERVPIAPPTERYPGLDLAAAYAIQQANLARRLGTGRTLVGHKIGLTSEPMQTLLGVNEPILWPTRVRPVPSRRARLACWNAYAAARARPG